MRAEKVEDEFPFADPVVHGGKNGMEVTLVLVWWNRSVAESIFIKRVGSLALFREAVIIRRYLQSL